MGVDHIGGNAGIRQELSSIRRDLRRVAKASIQNSSIGRAGLRVYDGGWIRIEDGGLQVTGTASVSGRLEGSGTFDWAGPMNLKGAQNVTGPTTFTGKMTVNGAWDINGNGTIDGTTTLTGDLNVTGAGRIKVGSSMTLNPAGSNGRIEFANGAQVFTDGTTIQVYKGNGVVQISDTEAKLQVGGSAVIVTSGNVKIIGIPSRTGTGLPAGAVGADADGTLWRAV